MSPVAIGCELVSSTVNPCTPTAAQEVRVPDWMQSALKHPDPEVRLKALEKWIEQNQVGVGPALLAMNDPDDRIRAKALQLIERDWATEQMAIQNMR
jgi:hypothetical protein